LDERLVARLFRKLRDAVHCPVEGLRLVPVGPAGRPIPDLCYPQRIDRKLIRRSPLGTERAPINRTRRVALDVDNLAVPHAHQLAAADSTVRTHARHFLRAGDPELPNLGLRCTQVASERQEPSQRKPARCGCPQKIATTYVTSELRHG